MRKNGNTVYDNLSEEYGSCVLVTDGTNSDTIHLTDDDVVWTADLNFRIAISIDQVNTALGTAYTHFFFGIELDFKINFITDVDVNPRNWPTASTQNSCKMSFVYEPYCTGLLKADLLGTATGIPAIPVDQNPKDFCTVVPENRWLCEAGEGAIWVVPYMEDRVIFENFEGVTGPLGEGIGSTTLDFWQTSANNTAMFPCARNITSNTYTARVLFVKMLVGLLSIARTIFRTKYAILRYRKPSRCIFLNHLLASGVVIEVRSTLNNTSYMDPAYATPYRRGL